MTFFKEHKLLIGVFLFAGVVDLLAAVLHGPILSGLLLSLQTFALYLWLSFRASEQVLRPQDGLTGLRYIILGFILAALIFSIPSIIYSIFRLMGIDTEFEWLRGMANITGGLSKIAAPILLVLVFEYTNKDK